MTLKVTDNQYSTVGYPSDSWASCTTTIATATTTTTNFGWICSVQRLGRWSYDHKIVGLIPGQVWSLSSGYYLDG